MKQVIQQGETIRLYVSYNDIDTGEAVDPFSLSCTIVQPDATNVVIVYPATDFVQESTGNFFVRFLGVQIGTHNYVITAQIGASDFDVRNGKFDVEEVL